jgi:hypothetical protein
LSHPVGFCLDLLLRFHSLTGTGAEGPGILSGDGGFADVRIRNLNARADPRVRLRGRPARKSSVQAGDNLPRHSRTADELMMHWAGGPGPIGLCKCEFGLVIRDPGHYCRGVVSESK